MIFHLILFFLIFNNIQGQQNLIENVPIISIVTSIYKGNKFIKHFLEDITKQTIFENCELILINANSPENEEEIIKPFLKKYKNIIYKRLKQRVSIYKAWNLAIKISKGKYIINANLDDRLAYNCTEIYRNFLDKNNNIDLVYSDGYFVNMENQNFQSCNPAGIIFKPEFSKVNLKINCLPSFNPMWRKALHEKYGFFKEDFNIAGDWEFWIRIANQNSIFKKIPGIYGVAYRNPVGLSSNPNTVKLLENEKNIIRNMYKNFFYG